MKNIILSIALFQQWRVQNCSLYTSAQLKKPLDPLPNTHTYTLVLIIRDLEGKLFYDTE